MARITQFEKYKKMALRTAFDFGYPTKFVEGIIKSKSEAQINQWMIAGRHSEQYESEERVRKRLAQKNIVVPSLRGAVGLSELD